MMFGQWQHSLKVGQETFRCDVIEGELLDRSEFNKVYALDGLPKVFLDDLVKASQVIDVPQTWRIKQLDSIDQVTNEILELGRQAIERDIKEFGTNIISYVAETDSEQVFVAAGAIRSKLNPEFENVQFPVVSRAVVHPNYRGQGIGSLIVIHRLSAALTYFDLPPKAIHFATESKKIISSVNRFEKSSGLKFIYIGDEQYSTNDGTHKETDYLCILPDYKKDLLSAAAHCGGEYKKDFELFISEGVNAFSGDDLEMRFQEFVVSNQLDQTHPSYILLSEFFNVRQNIGAKG